MKRAILLSALMLAMGLAGCAAIEPYDSQAVPIVSQRLHEIQGGGGTIDWAGWVASPMTASTTIEGLGTNRRALTAAELQASGGEPLVVAPSCSLGPPIFTNLRSTVETSQTLTCNNMPIGHLAADMTGSYSSRWEKRAGEWVMVSAEIKLGMQ